MASLSIHAGGVLTGVPLELRRAAAKPFRVAAVQSIRPHARPIATAWGQPLHESDAAPDFASVLYPAQGVHRTSSSTDALPVGHRAVCAEHRRRIVYLIVVVALLGHQRLWWLTICPLRRPELLMALGFLLPALRRTVSRAAAAAAAASPSIRRASSLSPIRVVAPGPGPGPRPRPRPRRALASKRLSASRPQLARGPI
ncbi:hypothetical protein GRF29_1g1710576 [Pseudopithomyces chartarum]|uniref:Uncharacterized protein n=1 Tax=Pseudopithomyces chartarum TaxID=1892770 RepID=A0AAN6M8E7_9PLEO|nr:hypothetical protein GRF29_1g1710576 [Pseudopithomyces chartarum]